MTTMLFRPSENKILFDYTKLEALSGDNDRVVFLSRRDYYLLLNSIEHIGKFRNRLYTSHIDDVYQIANDAQWEEFQQWVEDLENNLGGWPVSNEYLLRIAVALETMNEQAEHETLSLADVFEAFGAEPSEDVLDWVEAFQYLSTAIPGLPDLKIPALALPTWLGDMRFRGAVVQLMNDMAVSQRGMAVSQGGIDLAGLYTDYGSIADKMLLKAGFVGRAYWLWRWVSNDQLPGWLTWVTSIIGLALGSIRNATYQVATAIEELSFDGIVQAITDQTLTTVVNCNSCTMTEINEHLQPPGQPFYVTVEEDALWPDEGEPPVTGGEESIWNARTEDHQCQAANFIVDWLQAFYGSSEWALTDDDNLITLSDKAAQVLAELPPIGAVLSGIASIVGQALAYISGGSTDIFERVNEHITDRREDLVCALYNAETSSEARSAFRDIMIEEEINSLALSGLMVFLTMNNVMALLFYENELVEPLIELESDDCSECEDAGPYLIEEFDPLLVGDTCDISLDGGVYTVVAHNNAGRWVAAFHCVDPENVEIPLCFIIDDIDPGAADHTSYPDAVYLCGAEDYSLIDGGSFVTQEGLCVHGFILQSDVAFTATFTGSALTCS